MKHLIKRLILVLIIAASAYITVITVKMVQASNHVPQQNATSMIILGAKLKGDQLSLTLKSRMDAALIYLQKNPSTQVVVSGGQGSDELVPEADAMKDYLIMHQINPERIQVEAKSTNTFENIKFSKSLLRGDRILIVSNDFHLLRAKMIAKRQGLIVDTLPAPTPKSVWLQLYAREYVAIIKSYLLDR
jgi:uncharacterized SAM-binding protein YcdF (DUF218 family)